MADKKISALTAASTPLAGTEVLPIVQSGSTVKVPVSDLTAGRAVSGLSFSAGTNIGLQNTSATAYSGLALNSNDPNASTRNWAIATSYNDYGDMCFVQSATIGASPVGGTVRGEFSNTNGNFKVNTGNIVIGTAGKGIDFSANTHAAGMTSELLNGYEEGTWTTTFPNQSNITGALTLSNGKYTRVGRLVMIEGKFSGDVTAPLTATFFQFTLPIARAAATDSGAGNVMTATALKLGGIENAGADTTTAYVVMPSNSGQPTGVDTFLFTYTYSA